MQAPHRMIGQIGDGITTGVKAAVGGVAGAVQGAGKSIVRGVDTPFKTAIGKESPLHIVDALADGVVNAGVNFIDNGVIGSAQILGEGVMKALDKPYEQLAGGLTMPKFGKK